MSFDFDDFSIDNKMTKAKKNDKNKSEEGIRTTANSIAKESIPSHKESITDYKNTKSKYLTSGVQKG